MLLIKKYKRKRLANYLWLMGVVLLTLACNKGSTQTTEIAKSAKIDSITETYVELGFFGPVKPDRWTDLVQAVQNNIAKSRKEPGNLSFSLYVPEYDTLQPIWFERFKSKEAHSFHMQQDYFKKAIAVIKQSLAGEALSITLNEIKEIPAIIPVNVNAASSHSFTFYDVKPGKRHQFITAMADIAVKYRAVTNNVEYNLYQYKNEPDKFVIIEGWKNKRLNVQQPDASFLAAKPIYRVIKDISENKNVNH